MSPLVRRFLPTAPVTLLTVSLLAAVGSVQASGGPAPMTAADRNQIIGQSKYRCRGGIQVQVTQMPGTARVDFAGRSQTLELAPGGSGVAYQNNDFAWFSQGKTSYMKNTHSGNLALTDCVAIGN
ncbi:MliC family protein [Deinococcus radiomollis]|uniref:MliC family protein n=1 Tax=Deinococcus radiomollis TaxID=468916 RepID=UPI003891E872